MWLRVSDTMILKIIASLCKKSCTGWRHSSMDRTSPGSCNHFQAATVEAMQPKLAKICQLNLCRIQDCSNPLYSAQPNNQDYIDHLGEVGWGLSQAKSCCYIAAAISLVLRWVLKLRHSYDSLRRYPIHLLSKHLGTSRLWLPRSTWHETQQ